MIENANIHQSIRDTWLLEKNAEFIESKFCFQKNHKGLRPGKIHVLIGAPGSGKSTLVRSIISHVAIKNKIVMWLSEETYQDFIIAIHEMKIPDEVIENILVFSEIDHPPINADFEYYKIRMTELLLQHSPKVVFLDNLTTCQTYETLRPQGQSAYIAWLKELASKSDIAFFLVAHTDATIRENMNSQIDLNNIRGCKSAVNQAEIFYVYQRIRSGEKMVAFVNVQKSRQHGEALGHYLLEYNYNTKEYIRDKKINFDTIKKIFKDRDKL